MRTVLLASSTALARLKATSAGAFKRWKARRWAVFGPIPEPGQVVDQAGNRLGVNIHY